MRKLIPIYAILTALTLIVSASCNSSGNGDVARVTVVSANTLVSNFRLQKNDSVMTLLDSIPFTIDVNRRLIYNPDSLPKGTDITRLVASISLASSTSVGEISISGATTMKDTTYTYNASATDSIDFTGRVTLTVKAADGISTKQYLLQVNVHNLESDSLYWNKMSRRNLPGALTDPETAKAVACGGTTYCLVAENGNYTMSLTTDIATNNWNKQTVAFTFKPDVNSLTATDKALFVLDANEICTNPDRRRHQLDRHRNKYSSLIAGYGDTLLAVAASESGYFTVDLTDNGTETKTAAPKEFPVKGFSQAFKYNSDWGTSEMLFMVGGEMADGNYTGATPGCDGKNWASTGNRQLPKLTGITLVPYYYFQRVASGDYDKYPVLLAIGGRTANGVISKKVYISCNNGLDWKLGDDLLQLPELYARLLRSAGVRVDKHT